jgi:hypothetical protein
MCSTSITPAMLLEGRPTAGVLGQQGTYGVGDLAASAVPDRDVDHRPSTSRVDSAVS